jgi:hypothetical protein
MYMHVISIVYLIESLYYACLLTTTIYVVKVFFLCILKFQKCIAKRKKSKGGLEGSVPQPVGGWVCYRDIAWEVLS